MVKRIFMFTKLATMLICVMIFLSTTAISCYTIKVKRMKKFIPKHKFQFLHVDNFEIILKFLTFDDLPHFLCACEKSKSKHLTQTIVKLFKTFYEKQIQNSIEYLSSETFHAKQQLKKKSTQFFEKFRTPKTISLPKFVKHAIQTPKFRIVSHIDGSITIEQKCLILNQYSTVTIQDLLFSRHCKNFNSNISLIKFFNLIFSSKYFITSILNDESYISIIFQAGEIFLCGKTGKTKIFYKCNEFKSRSYFISRNTTYIISFLETSDDFVVYHISSRELFSCENSSLKSIVLNPNSKLDYNFFKKNGKFSGFAKPTDFLYKQIMGHSGENPVDISATFFNSNVVDEMLNEMENI